MHSVSILRGSEVSHLWPWLFPADVAPHVVKGALEMEERKDKGYTKIPFPQLREKNLIAILRCSFIAQCLFPSPHTSSRNQSTVLRIQTDLGQGITREKNNSIIETIQQ